MDRYLEDEYRSLFSLPSLKKLAIFTIIVSSLFNILLAGIIPNKLQFLNSIFLCLLSSLTLFLFIVFFSLLTTAIIGEERKILDFRRALGLYTLAITLSLPLLMIALLIKLLSLDYYHPLYFLGIGISLSYTILALASVVKIGYIKPVLLANSFFISLSSINALFYTFPFHGVFYVKIAVSQSIYTMISIVTLYSVKALGKDFNLDALDAFRGFMAGWLSRIGTKMEAVFERLGVKRDVLMGLVKFKRSDGSLKACWIISNVHPGPFLNIASGDLPYFLAKHIEDMTDANCVSVLHGTCSHYHNLVSSEEKYRLLELILENLKIDNGVNLISKPKVINSGELSLYYQKLGDINLGIVYSENTSLDDLSYSLGLLVYEKYLPLGLKTLICDAHSSLDRSDSNTATDIKPWNPLGRKIIDLFDKALEEDLSERVVKFNLGVNKVRDCGLDIKDGLGSDGISSYIFDLDGSRSLILVFDSNNLQLGLHKMFREHLISKYGFENVVIVTTDTHEVNAISPKEGSYPLLTKEKFNEMLKCAELSIENALRNMEPVYVEGKTFFARDVRVLGEDAYYFLKSLIKNGLNTFRFVFNTGLLLSSILVFILSLI